MRLNSGSKRGAKRSDAFISVLSIAFLIKGLCARWRQILVRLIPGGVRFSWPVCQRKWMWHDTQDWLPTLFATSKDWPVAERLLLFREINWRLEAAMVPLFLHIIEPFETAINDAFAVLSTGKPLQTATTSSEIGIIGKPEEILDAWSNIAFGLMREARETYNESRWKSLDSQIEKITSQITRLNDRKCYERALWAIWNLKRDKANEELNRWQPSPHPAALIYRTRG